MLYLDDPVSGGSAFWCTIVFGCGPCPLQLAFGPSLADTGHHLCAMDAANVHYPLPGWLIGLDWLWIGLAILTDLTSGTPAAALGTAVGFRVARNLARFHQDQDPWGRRWTAATPGAPACVVTLPRARVHCHWPVSPFSTKKGETHGIRWILRNADRPWVWPCSSSALATACSWCCCLCGAFFFGMLLGGQAMQAIFDYGFFANIGTSIVAFCSGQPLPSYPTCSGLSPSP